MSTVSPSAAQIRPKTPVTPPDRSPVLRRLQRAAGDRDLSSLSDRLATLSELVAWDASEIDTAIASLPTSDRHVHRAAHHLLALGGKRLRPVCVVLASRLGGELPESRHDLAIAVELVHCATLLHDDVVDEGDVRRGAEASRVLFGNAASVFAGDWLLVEALRRVRATRVDEALGRLLDVIEEMIVAESLQLEARGTLNLSEDRYFQVVEGKTAALFRWAMFAGASAAGLSPAQRDKLEAFGRHLGVAFQLIDDLLDYAGDADVTGKALFTDLREGKATYPILYAAKHDAEVRALALRAMKEGHGPEGHRHNAALLAKLRELGALKACRELADDHANQARAILLELPRTPARDALLTVTDAIVTRDR